MKVVLDSNVLQLAINTLGRRPYEEVSGVIQALSMAVPFPEAFKEESARLQDVAAFEAFKAVASAPAPVPPAPEGKF